MRSTPWTPPTCRPTREAFAARAARHGLGRGRERRGGIRRQHRGPVPVAPVVEEFKALDRRSCGTRSGSAGATCRASFSDGSTGRAVADVGATAAEAPVLSRRRARLASSPVVPVAHCGIFDATRAGENRMTRKGVPTFHVGIIMDGNGRWAEARGLGRVAGHARGARRVTEIVKACPDLGVTHLTLYAFSTENWRRPLAEVEGLMRIFRQYIRQDGRPPPQRRAGALHRHAASGAGAAARADGDARDPHRRLPRPEPDDRHRLRRPRRAHAGRARSFRATSREAGSRPAAIDEAALVRGARHPRPARPGPHHPHLGRASASRTSCSGRASMPSTTSRDRLAGLHRRSLAEAIDAYQARQRRFGLVAKPARAISSS